MQCDNFCTVLHISASMHQLPLLICFLHGCYWPIYKMGLGIDPDIGTKFECSTHFFISNTFFQISLIVAWLFNKLSLKCFVSVAYYIEILSYWDSNIFNICFYVYVLVYICLIYVIYFSIIIFITSNQMISLIQTNLFFGHVCQKLERAGVGGGG